MIRVGVARSRRRHISIEYRTPDRAIILGADEAQLRQITLNLLLNALDAVADNGTIWIEIGALADAYWRLAGRMIPRIQEPSGQGVSRVADNGRGLPSKDRDRIFEPFFSTKRIPALGLLRSWPFAMRIVVESHGGSIDVSTRPGGGAVFNVFIPTHAPADDKTIPLPAFGAVPALQLEGIADA